MITAFMNMKGGVGKTTLCVHLAGTAASNGKRVLIVDYDPQYNATQHLMPAKDYFPLKEERKTIYGVIQPKSMAPSPFEVDISPRDVRPPPLSEVVYHLFNVRSRGGVIGTVDLVPGSDELMYLVLGRTDKSTQPMEERFHSFLDEANRSYDLVFIDCHPAGSFLTKSALLKTDLVITPVVPDSYSGRGVVLMREFLDYLAKFRKDRPDLKIVFNCIPYQNRDIPLEQGIRNTKDLKAMFVESVLHESGILAKAGRIEGHSWRRVMQWSKKPWSSRVKRQLHEIYKEIFEG